MSIENVLSLLGGLALFLHGMQMMSSGLEAAAGNRMKSILERLTSNRFLGVLVGAVITAVIQSSSATTVMVVGFVNSGMMTLQQAVWIIMGANIGTTITGQLIALDVGVLAPFFAFVGVAMCVFVKKPIFHHYGSIIGGLGVLFIGMDMMSASMAPLRDMPAFVDLMTRFSNPVLGILAGAVFTAIIQSSSATVGILQALANSGVVTLDSAVFVLFGQNIGTCITAVLAAIGTNRNAKRTTIIHLMFNVIGTCVFTVLCLVTPLVPFMQGLTPDNPAGQIANMHTLFNVVTTLLLLPLGTKLVQVAMRILPERKEDMEEGMHLAFLTPITGNQDRSIGVSAIYISQLRQELSRMLAMARENVNTAFQAVLDRDPSLMEKEDAIEEYLDYLNKEISQFISHVIVHETNEQDSAMVSAYFKVTGNIERIGDHAMNICGYCAKVKEKDVHFSPEAREEIEEMRQTCLDALDLLDQSGMTHQPSLLPRIEDMEQKIDDMTGSFRERQLARMREGICSDEGCILFSEMLTDFERIGDHALNIAQELTGNNGE
ncbi:Na/Pi cotransporter family protein [uncultured Intestinimonas sp.]|uniref:Na/Pi cotransporter family protein n=1 Tax=uncultured Intestinimonas sp. TaxID=1689265 RepID=UPI0025F0AA82|nr:Na/Pi cotransporter family protein [uncultured Intestinimonas sp.]